MAKEKDNKVKNDNKHFMKDVKAELKKVVWPTSKQMVNNVTAVLTIVLVTAALVFCLDFVFNLMNKYGINKIKENVQSKNQQQTQVINQVNTDEQSNNSEDNTANDSSNEGTGETNSEESTNE